MEITGDKGGKQIIKRYPEDVTYLKISDERELQDVDVPLWFRLTGMLQQWVSGAEQKMTMQKKE